MEAKPTTQKGKEEVISSIPATIGNGSIGGGSIGYTRGRDGWFVTSSV